jgi:hypothetical protein
MEAKLERGDDAEVRASASHRPEQTGLVGFRCTNKPALSCHEFDGREVVERQSEPSLEPADPATERQTRDAGMADGSNGADEPVVLEIGRASCRERV